MLSTMLFSSVDYGVFSMFLAYSSDLPPFTLSSKPSANYTTIIFPS